MWPFSKSKPIAPPVKPVRYGSAIRGRRILPSHASFLREVHNFGRKVFRMYEASVSTNLNVDFPISITSANAEILVSINGARSRARRLERDNPYAWAILQSFQNNVCGEDPFRLEMRVGKYNAKGQFVLEKETNRLIQDKWKQAGLKENCTVGRDMSRLEVDLQAITAMARDGGILFRHHRAFPKNRFGYAIEPIESDRLDHYWSRPKRDDGTPAIQFSIELDDYLGPVAYWILQRHPGDIFAYSQESKYRERVPAEDIIAFFDIRTRAGQMIGMPRFSSIIARLHRIDQFDIAHVTAAIWAACKPFFITQEFPTANEYVPDFIKQQMQSTGESDLPGEGEGDKVSNVEPGTGEILAYGQKPVLVDPKFPVEAATDFKKDSLRGASAGSGTPYFTMANDLESVNFSSGRLGLEHARDGFKILQEHFIDNFRRPHFNEWLKYAILSGEVPISVARLEELQMAAVFHGRRWGYINPMQDAQADIMGIEAGLTSRSRVIADSERGGNVEEVDSEIANDKEIDEAHGLDFTVVSKPTISKGQPGPGPDDEQGGADQPETTPKKNGKAHHNGFKRATRPRVSRNGNI